MTDGPRGVLLDVDGTLVDSVYHHALAWQEAFAGHGLQVPVHVCHRYIGMGGDQLVTAVAGDDVERRLGDALRTAHDEAFSTRLESVPPLPGAADLLRTLHGRGHTLVLASSGKEHEVDHYVGLLGAADLIQDATTSKDVTHTKPDPDAMETALEALGHRDAVMVGDSPWDVESAARAGIPCIGVLTGGFCRDQLSDAVTVVATLAEVPAAIASLGRQDEGIADLEDALTRLEGEVAADPGLAQDEGRFGETVDRIADGDPELRGRLRALRDKFLEAGS